MKLKILGAICAVAMIAGCSGKLEEDNKTKEAKVVKAVKKDAYSVLNKQEKTTKKIELVKNLDKKQASKQLVDDVLGEAKKTTETLLGKATEAASDAKKKVAQKVSDLTYDAVVKIKNEAPSKGKLLYGKCQSCHGKNGQIKALGRSASISGWTKAKLIDSLKEYRAGTKNEYGMGGLMKTQTSSLSDEDIDAISSHISSLGK